MIGAKVFHSALAVPGGERAVRPWLGGFNLLPYRQRNAQLARRRRFKEWLAAALGGGAALLAVIGWQAAAKARIDAQRLSLEHTLSDLSAPLAEHARLVQAQDERHQGEARAKTLSEPLAHLRDLLDALSVEPGDGVVLQQLRHGEHETALLATSRAHIASAEWLERLSAVRGVRGADVGDLHRAPSRGNAAAGGAGGTVEFNAHLRWSDGPPNASTRRPVKSGTSGGAK